MILSEQHREYLNNHAVSDETLEAWPQLRSEGDEIVFPWTDGDLYTEQRRPWPGESGTYFWESGKDLHFWTLRDAGANSPILLVEGTKQALAAVSYASDTFTVMGMAGCWGWSKCKLSRFKGRDVYLCLDADAASNLDVFEAGEKLGEKMKRYGTPLRYLRIPGSGSQGLDDYLAGFDDDERADMLAYEIEHAAAKPADRRPTARKRKMESDLPDTGGRTPVAVNLDRKQVIDKIVGALKEHHDGLDLFNYGDVLTRVKGHETQPLDRDRFYALLVNAVACFRYSEATDKRPAIFEDTWPDSQSIGAVMSKAEEFSPLRRVVRVPFLRPDGSLCTTAGYDRETATVLVPTGLKLTVPEEPTPEQTRMAAKFLMDDWLGDLPFETDADRANALAMLLTPFIRGIVPLAPLAVVNGLEAGVGKNLLADCVAILATGQAAMPLPYVNNDDEMRKQITAGFAGGAELFIFDEAHVVEGTQFARAVTSLTYGDRILGVSRIAQFPNTVTWMSLGNQVQVNGDMSRRVYFVCLSPSGTTLSDRESYAYRHPDLKAWTTENRDELVSAALTVLRGWVCAGRPKSARSSAMGSFEPWDRLMSGTLAYAGFPEFLSDTKGRRSESDFTASYWEAHVTWLYGEFGASEFTTRQVQEAALRDPKGYEAPPGMEDASGKNYTRALGQGYSKHRNRTYNNLRLVKAGMGHKSTLKWQIDPGKEVEGGNGGNPTTLRTWGERLSETSRVSEHMRVREGAEELPPLPPATSTVTSIGFDLETASVKEMYLGGHEGPFVRLAGLIEESQPEGVTGRSADALTGSLNEADEIYGANIFGFDLQALAHHHGADFDALAAKAVDLTVRERLLDPPGAKGMKPWGERGYYGLDAIAQRYGVTGKTHDLKALADQHGGYDKIPLNDPEYNDYLRGDLAATAAVKELQDKRVEESGRSDYIAREMRVQALLNRMPLNGWKVDTELLAERVAEEAAKRAEAIQILRDEYGMPTHKPDRFKLKLKAEWPTEMQTLSATEARAVLVDQPEKALSFGLATRIPGEELAKPWTSKEGKPAIVAAFAAAGAPHYPQTPNGDIKLSSEALGEGTWYDTENRRAVKGMLHPEAYGRNPAVRRLCEVIVQATGAREKYAEIARYVTAQGRVHPELSGTRPGAGSGSETDQATGRFALAHPSLTNIGTRGAAAQERAVMIADEGRLLVTCDLSQVDMRAIAGLCQDPEYMSLFEPGRDAHMEMSEVYFGERTKEARDKTKAINHKVNYGGNAKSTSEMNGIPLHVVEGALKARAEAYPRLIEWTEEVRNLAASGALLDNGFGRLMRPDPQRAFTQGPALMGQGAARDIMCESLLRMVDRDRRATQYIRGVVHDEVVLSVPEADVAYWQELLKDAFTWEWRGVPILCELGTPARRWVDCK